jgi:hypothetical protein
MNSEKKGDGREEENSISFSARNETGRVRLNVGFLG